MVILNYKQIEISQADQNKIPANYYVMNILFLFTLLQYYTYTYINQIFILSFVLYLENTEGRQTMYAFVNLFVFQINSVYKYDLSIQFLKLKLNINQNRYQLLNCYNQNLVFAEVYKEILTLKYFKDRYDVYYSGVFADLQLFLIFWVVFHNLVYIL
ncbi:hypothetical protein pb186bvf_003770 [Paramecium bursaria]